MSDMKRLDRELQDVILSIRLQARADGWHKLRDAVLDIHSPIRVVTPENWPSGSRVCAECRTRRGELRVVWPCRTATVAMEDNL